MFTSGIGFAGGGTNFGVIGALPVDSSLGTIVEAIKAALAARTSLMLPVGAGGDAGVVGAVAFGAAGFRIGGAGGGGINCVAARAFHFACTAFTKAFGRTECIRADGLVTFGGHLPLPRPITRRWPTGPALRERESESTIEPVGSGAGRGVLERARPAPLPGVAARPRVRACTNGSADVFGELGVSLAMEGALFSVGAKAVVPLIR